MATSVRYSILLVLSLCFSMGDVFGNSGLTLAPVFSDHMVLQRNKPVTIFGNALAGSLVKVNFIQQTLTATADQSGKWKAVFPASKHGGPYTLSVVTPDRKIVLNDVLIGDVWLCSGQSNMDFALQNTQTGPEELKYDKFNSSMRLLKMGGLVSTGNAAWTPSELDQINRHEFFSGDWQTLNSRSAAAFSAVAYYFGKKIATSEDIPVGLIQVAVGGSPTESWIDRKLLEQDQQFAGVLDDWQNSPAVMEWCRERAAINTAHAKSIKQLHPYQPGYNFQAGIAPLTDFPITGVIWYQGESNVHNVPLHAHLLQLLVKSWRQKWGYEFPFYYVQLSGIERPDWPEFRDSQRMLSTKIPNTGIAVSYDLGDSLNVRPIRKREIGERLALLALHDVYKKNVVANGPILAKAIKKGKAIEILFSSASKLLTRDNQPLMGFELVTEEGDRMPASASIRDNRVILVVPDGRQIKTVLYAYQPFTRANLYNEAGLPAATFSMILQ